MTLREKQTDFMVMISKLICFASEVLQDPITPLEWMRSAERQALLLLRKATKVKHSKHQDGLAFDFCFLSDLKDDGILNYTPNRYRKLGECWEKLGGIWGGRFGDNPATENIEGWDAGHFEWKEKVAKIAYF